MLSSLHKQMGCAVLHCSIHKMDPRACRHDQRRHKENMSGCYATGAVCLCMRAPLPCMRSRNAFAFAIQLHPRKSSCCTEVGVGVTQGTVRASQHLVAPSRSDFVEFCSCIAHPQFLHSGHRGCQRHRAVLSVWAIVGGHAQCCAAAHVKKHEGILSPVALQCRSALGIHPGIHPDQHANVPNIKSVDRQISLQKQRWTHTRQGTETSRNETISIRRRLQSREITQRLMISESLTSVSH